MHLLVQEFFAGRAITSQQFLGEVVSDSWWTKAIVFYFGENPGDSHGLAALRNGLKCVIGADEFQAAIAVGLAAQACYLMKSIDKVEAVRWVVDTMSSCKEPVLAQLTNEFPDMEVVPLLHYYFYGRDAVAAKIIADVTSVVQEESRIQNVISEEQIFWCIAGLIEARKLDEAYACLKSFNPQDIRLLLALQVGALAVQHIHVTDKETKHKAQEISTYLDRKVGFMHEQVIKEIKSLLLEVRQGELRAIDGPTNGGPSVSSAN